MFRKEPLDFPKTILIETCNLCQGECKFCPYIELRKSEPLIKLSEEKYMDLLQEIKEKGNITRLTLFNNNEPLLDNRIYKFIKVAHDMFPNVEIGLSSNGRIISKEILERLKDVGLTTIYISIPCVDRDNYKEIMGIYPDKILDILTSINDEDLVKMIRIAVPKTKYFDLDSMKLKLGKYMICSWNIEYKECWGISSKFKSVVSMNDIAGPCDRPMDQAVVSADGDVIICCRDWQKQNVIGNVYEDSLYNIWHSEKMKAIQQIISAGDLTKIECCKDCFINKGVYKR